MITRRPVAAAMAALCFAPVATRAWAQEPGITGTWTGVLVAGQAKLRLRLVLAADGAVKLYSLDQGGISISGTAVSTKPDQIAVEIPAVGGRFAGKLTSADRLEGTWSQGGSDFPLMMMRGEAGLPKPPTRVAPPPPAALTQALLEQLREASGSPALGAAAQRKGGKTLAWVTGHRRVGTADVVGLQDRWHLGSITKSMTATLIGRLVESGQLRWDDTVGDLLGDVAPDMRPEYRPVTLRHLGSHRSGLPGDLSSEQISRFRFSSESADARDERLAYARLALAMPPKGQAGTRYEYANNGYVVLGAIIERRLKKPWEIAIRERLFEPLKLTSVGFGAPDLARATQPSGHTAQGDAVLRAFPGSDNPAVLGPAGRVHMSLRDLIAYLAAHRDRSALLAPETWRTLHTPPFGGNYAMGWMVRPNGALWHNGANGLWYAMATFHPDQGFAAAAVVNDGRIAIVSPIIDRAVQDAILSAQA